MVEYGLVALVGYLIGSIPSGLLIGKAVAGIDLRRHGSGNPGAANALRILGPRASAVIFAADITKGLLPVAVVGYIYGGNTVQVIAALAALAGHNWPIYAGFRGGKGVATVLGGLLVISPVTFLATVFVAFILIAKYRYVSLGSVVGAFTAFLVLSLHTLLTSGPIIYFPYAVIGASLVIFRHRDNIRRLTMGTEARIGGGARS